MLIAWITGDTSLIELTGRASDYMNPLTAISLGILGFTLVYISEKNYDKVKFLLFIVLFIALARMFGSIFVSIPDIDLILFTDLANKIESRMSIFTAISILLISLSILIKNNTSYRSQRVSVVLSTIVTILSFTSIASYLAIQLNISELPFFEFTSFLTAISLFILSFSVQFITLKIEKDEDDNLLEFLNVRIYVILFLSLTVTIFISSWIYRSVINEARNNFELITVEAIDKINERIRIYSNLLISGKAFLNSSENVTRDDWKTFVDTLEVEENYPGIQGIGYSIFIKPEDLESHINSVRAEGFPNYNVNPEGNRDLYSSIIYLEPFDVRNQRAFGYDMYSNEVRNQAMNSALQSGDPKLSGRVILVQEFESEIPQPGFLIYVPVYKTNEVPLTEEERIENIVGFSYSPFRAYNFFEGIFGNEGIDNISMTVFDGISSNPENILFENDSVKFTEPINNQFVQSHTLYAEGRPWTIIFKSGENFGISSLSKNSSLVTALIGVAISILVATLFYISSSLQNRAENLAKKATKDLTKSQAKDEAILSSIGDGLVATNSEGEIILINPSFTQLLGWAEEESIGQKLSSLVKMIDDNEKLIPEDERPITNSIKTGEPYKEKQTNINYVKKDGDKLAVSISVAPIKLNNEMIGAVEIFRDITDLKELDISKSQFVSLASHQLRTPLTSIKWNTESILSNKKISKKVQSSINEISLATNEMSTIVNSLLILSQIELNSFQLHLEETNLNDLITNVLDSYSSLAKERKVTIKINLDAKNMKFLVDPKHIEIVYENLINNAILYSEENSTIEINQSTNNNHVLFTVKDNGYGIPDEDKHRIFNKFYRASNILKHDTKGTGIGLFITKKIVDQHGGRIWFESELEKGTTFYLELPLNLKKVDSKKTPRLNTKL